MGTVIKELVTQGHELVALLGTQHGMHDAASLVQRLTAQLDITAVALQEMTRKRDAEHGDVLTWEKTMFKVCGEDGHKSVAAKFAELEAKCEALAAENAGLKQNTPDLQTMMSALDAFFADEEVPERAMLGAYNILRGAVLTPATDAYLAEVRAQGVELFAREMHADISEADAIEFAAMLQGSPALHEETQRSKCWCRTCRPVNMTDMRFVVCPECGNKRCPRANDCSNVCSGSNEPGQEGSAYPAAPQQEAE